MSIFLLLIGCVKPFKRVSPDFQNPAEYDVLFVAGVVDTQQIVSTASAMAEPSVGEAIVAGIVEVVEATRLYPILDEFSADGTARLEEEIWKKEGFPVRKDPELVQEEMSENTREFAREVDYISGMWYHPEGNGFLQLDNDSFSTQKMRARWIKDYNTPKEKEAFLFSTISVAEVQTGFFRKSPMVIVDTVIIGEEGKYLYQSRGVGYGYPSRMAIDYRRESLDYGLREALDSLTEVETEIIEEKKK